MARISCQVSCNVIVFVDPVKQVAIKQRMSERNLHSMTNGSFKINWNDKNNTFVCLRFCLHSQSNQNFNANDTEPPLDLGHDKQLDRIYVDIITYPCPKFSAGGTLK